MLSEKTPEAKDLIILQFHLYGMSRKDNLYSKKGISDCLALEI